MEVSLKKAHELSQNLNQKLSSVQLITDITVPLMKAEKLDEGIEELQKLLETNVQKYLEIRVAVWHIRELLTVANARYGINQQLNTIAGIKDTISRFQHVESMLLRSAPQYSSRHGRFENIFVEKGDIIKYFEAIKERASKSEDVDVTTVSATFSVKKLQDEMPYKAFIEDLKLSLAEANDKLTELNTLHKIALPEGVVSLLKEYKIVR